MGLFDELLEMVSDMLLEPVIFMVLEQALSVYQILYVGGSGAGN